MVGIDAMGVLKIFLEYMHKYPELLEFPNGVQNIMTLFYSEIKYDIPLLRQIMQTLGNNFNLTMAKDQFLQKLHDENEEPYVEYLQPCYLILMNALKMALQPGLP
jgi:hypothetical protein